MSAAAALAREIAEIRAMVTGLTTPQLAYSSIEAGAIAEFDLTGRAGAQFGQQFDGTHMANSLNGPVPPTPSAPIIQPTLFGVEVAWDGTFTDASNAPTDWSRLEVHAGDAPGFDATGADTIVGTIETPRGATVIVPYTDYVPHYFKFYARSLSGGLGPVSAEETGTALKLTAADSTVDFSLLGTITITFATTAPGSPALHDVWVKTNSTPVPNLVFQWNGTTWVDITALPIANAIRAAATAQTTADGKIKTFVQGTAPTASGVGDLWIDSSSGNKVNRWDGSAWQPYAFGDLAISSLSAAKITTGILTASVTVSGRLATALTGARVELNSAGLQAFNSSGVQTVSIDTSGNAYLAGVFESKAGGGERVHIEAGGSLVGTTQISFYTGSVYETDIYHSSGIWTSLMAPLGNSYPGLNIASGYFTPGLSGASAIIQLYGSMISGPPTSSMILAADSIDLDASSGTGVNINADLFVSGRMQANRIISDDTTGGNPRVPGTRVKAAALTHTSTGNYQVLTWSDYAETANEDVGPSPVFAPQSWLGWFAATPTRFIAPVDGFYRLEGCWAWAGSATGNRVLSIRRNAAGNPASGTSICFFSAAPPPTSLYQPFAMGEIWMNANDYLEVFGNQNSGGNLGMGSAGGAASFAAWTWQHAAK